MSGRKRDPVHSPAPSDGDQENQTPHDEGKLGDSYSDRSANSVEKGGQNEKQGEPAPGYGTVAPGNQGGGQRR